jgi:hypothetical protein
MICSSLKRLPFIVHLITAPGVRLGLACAFPRYVIELNETHEMTFPATIRISGRRKLYDTEAPRRISRELPIR